MDAVWLGKDILEGNLDMIADILWVTYLKIWGVEADLIRTLALTFTDTLTQTHLGSLYYNLTSLCNM